MIHTVVITSSVENFISYSIPNKSVNWNNPTVAGTYKVKVTVTISTTGMTVIPKSSTFTLKVSYTC